MNASGEALSRTVAVWCFGEFQMANGGPYECILCVTQVKRFDSVTRSPVYASFGAMLKVSHCTLTHTCMPALHPTDMLANITLQACLCRTHTCMRWNFYHRHMHSKLVQGDLVVLSSIPRTAFCAGTAHHQGL